MIRTQSSDCSCSISINLFFESSKTWIELEPYIVPGKWSVGIKKFSIEVFGISVGTKIDLFDFNEFSESNFDNS